VSSMCERIHKRRSSSGGESGGVVPVFDTFSLAYASNKLEPKCYIYGAHVEDWTTTTTTTAAGENATKASMGQEEEKDNNEQQRQRRGETYYQRLARWEKTYKKERQRERNYNADMALHERPPTKEIPLNHLYPSLPSSSTTVGEEKDYNATRTSLHPDTLVTAIQPNHLLTNTLNNGDNCVICQEHKAQIVFQPCMHCLICVRCLEMGYCPKFCPSCRVDIKSSCQPSYLKLVRPRVYSTQLFL